MTLPFARTLEQSRPNAAEVGSLALSFRQIASLPMMCSRNIERAVERDLDTAVVRMTIDACLARASRS